MTLKYLFAPFISLLLVLLFLMGLQTLTSTAVTLNKADIVIQDNDDMHKETLTSKLKSLKIPKGLLRTNMLYYEESQFVCGLTFHYNPPNIFKEFNIDSLELPSFEGNNKASVIELIPETEIIPKYPRKAATAKIEGWVKIEFTVNESGKVLDPRVVESKPGKIFDRAALRAILRAKFNPHIVDGKSVVYKTFRTIEFKNPKVESNHQHKNGGGCKNHSEK